MRCFALFSSRTSSQVDFSALSELLQVLKIIVTERHAAEAWTESLKFVSDKAFFIKLATCDADILTVDQMKVLKKYVDRAEFNANKIEHESVVCACLCRWIGAFLELAW